jgi:aminodeoxyfutalosine deaminase
MSSGSTRPLPLKLLTARHVWTAAGPLQRACGIIIQGERVFAIGDADLLKRDYPISSIIDFGNAIVMPGLVNAHTHLELSHLRPGNAPSSFVDWIDSVRAAQSSVVDREAVAADSARIGMQQSLGFGMTCVGDISQQSRVTRSALKSGPLRVVSFGECLGLAKLKWKCAQLADEAFDVSNRSGTLRIGVSLHAPYTVDYDDYSFLSRAAMESGLALATHLAESPDEAQFLRDHTGPFRDLWERLGLWSEDVPTFAHGPIFFAASATFLHYRPLLAHVNYCNDDELAFLSTMDASVVYCPRTHKFFGHPPHRWQDMLAAGINVAAGTDSCASSPNLNLIEELRLLHEIAPEVSTETLWRMGTLNGAKALQWDDEIGSIQNGKSADLTIFNVSTNDPLREILEDSTRLPSQVWIKGNPVSPC